MIYRENGILESFGGFTNINSQGDERAYTLEDGWGIIGGGNVIESFGRCLLFVGSGTLKVLLPVVSSSVQTIGSASSIPQISVLSGGSYLAPRQMGLSPQGTAPLLSEPSVLGAGFSGKITGSIAMEIARRRSITGALSIASPSSNVIQITGKSVYVQIPTMPSDGSDYWRLYPTEQGGGSLGNFLQFPIEIAESDVAGGTVNGTYGNAVVASTGVSRVIEIEYQDNDLLPLSPVNDYFPAQAADFIEKLGNYTLLIGTNSGLGIWPSVANNPEAYDPLDVQFLPEPVVGIVKPHDGYLFVICRNSIHIVMASGAVEGSPIVIRPVYQLKGIATGKAACAIGDELYLMSSGGMPFRLTPDGQYDDSFSLPVRGYFTAHGWDMSDVTVAYHENPNTVLFCYGSQIMCFHLDNQNRMSAWSPPVVTTDCVSPGKPSGIVRSAYTQNGNAYLIFNNSGSYSTWQFDTQNAGSSWIIQTADFFLDDKLAWKDIIGGKVSYRMNGTGLTACNAKAYQGVTVSLNVPNPAFGSDAVSDYIPMNVYDFVSTNLNITGSGLQNRIYGFEFDVVTHRIR
jgi:hypothetical protein